MVVCVRRQADESGTDGVAVGNIWSPNVSPRTVVWSVTDGLRDLNALTFASGWNLSWAVGINAAGQIVGSGDAGPWATAFKAIHLRCGNHLHVSTVSLVGSCMERP